MELPLHAEPVNEPLCSLRVLFLAAGREGGDI